MPQSGMDYWVIAGVLAAIVAAYLTWRGLRGRKPDIEQNMSNSTRGSQKVTPRDGAQVRQNMKDSTDGDQQA